MITPRSRKPLVCQEVVELITDYLEGALAKRDQRRFEHHLKGCPHCTEYMAQMRETLRLTGRLVPEDLPAEVSAEFTAIFKRWRGESQDPEQ
jgi:anti-sigma factor RsiW